MLPPPRLEIERVDNAGDNTRFPQQQCVVSGPVLEPWASPLKFFRLTSSATDAELALVGCTGFETQLFDFFYRGPKNIKTIP